MLDPQKQQEALQMLQGNQAPEEESVAPQDEGAAPMGAPDMGGEAATPTSDQLSNEDLAQLGGGPSGQDPQVDQIIQALEDPNTPPEIRQRIQTMIGLAARRRMAGINA